MAKEKIFLFSVLSLFFVLSVGFAWFDDNLPYRKKITLNPAESEEFDFQYLLNVTYETEMTNGFDDLRFTYLNRTDNTETEIPYCLGRDCSDWVNNDGSLLNLTTVNGSYTDVILRVPYSSTTKNVTVYMYYGNNSYPSKSSLKDTLLFNDEFNDNYYNATEWACFYCNMDYSITESNGIFNITVWNNGWMYSDAFLDWTIANVSAQTNPMVLWVSAQVKRSTTNDYGNTNFISWDTTHIGGSPDNYYILRYYIDTIYQVIRANNGTFSSDEVTIPDTMNDGQYHTYIGFLTKDFFATSFDGSLKTNSTSVIPNDPDDIFPVLSLGTSVYGKDGFQFRELDIDYVRARKFLYSTPTYLMGSEQGTCYPNWTYTDYAECYNSTNNKVVRVWLDTNYCDDENTTYNETVGYPAITYTFSHLETECFNSTRVTNWYWFNDTLGCGYYYNITNTTDCFVAVCGDGNCSVSYKCSVGACVVDYAETQTSCCSDCGSPDPFTECKDNTLRDKPTERVLTQIGHGVGNLFSGFGVPLLVFILLMAVGSALGFILSSVGSKV